METIRVKQNAVDGPHVEGYPDAVKLIAITERKAKRIAHMLLHMTDLQFSLNSLNALNVNPIDPHVRESLWRSAILHYWKCFGANASRSALDPTPIYRDEPPIAMEHFNYVKNLRNKHLAHDDNAFAQAFVGAAINDGTKSFKVEKIIALALCINTLEQDHYSNTKLLVEKALQWVILEFDRLTDTLTRQLEAKPYDELRARPEVTYTIPSIEQVATSRVWPPGG